VLQSRPHTFAQTNLSRSFFACDKTLTDNFRVARENEAAGAADATALGDASSSCGTHLLVNCGSQGGSCDPSAPDHAGGTPAS
jgi:hypothetical protein